VASVLGLPLELTESEEGSAFGAALLGGVAAGVYTDVDEAVARCVRVVETVEPDPALLDVYGELHARYAALYPALRQVRLGG
jgi:xylulokinase